ncbi:MAG: YncE family protein [Mucilaginibacter sp.]|uniref:YncE family protein n=1 Tax=Mucilaginibacter sp. TaxID=1882438 RepID=UPI00319F55B7
MKQLKLKNLFIGVAAISSLASCHKDKINPNDDKPIDPLTNKAGIYILNQGAFNANNSTLTYYDYASKKLVPDQFKTINGRGLGDTGNDIKIYGSKMYIVVNVSSTVEVADAKTAKSIKKLDFFDNTVARQPRSVAFYKNMALITSYDGTVAVLDTASLTVTKYIKVGRNPEQLVVANDKLYVANSGGLDFGNPDKTVSVVDLNTLTETKKITVALNPVSIAADKYGDVYVISMGDFDKVLPSLTIINTATDAVKQQSDLSAAYGTPIITSGDFAYFVTADNKIQVFNVKTETLEKASFISDGTVVTTPFGLKIDEETGELFVTDAKDYKSNGEVFAFDKTGKKEYSLTTGITPGAIAFVKK